MACYWMTFTFTFTAFILWAAFETSCVYSMVCVLLRRCKNSFCLLTMCYKCLHCQEIPRCSHFVSDKNGVRVWVFVIETCFLWCGYGVVRCIVPLLLFPRARYLYRTENQNPLGHRITVAGARDTIKGTPALHAARG